MKTNFGRSRERLGILLGLWLCVLVLASGRAQTIDTNTLVLSWDPSPDPLVTGYWVYYGQQSRDYQFCIFLGNQTNTMVLGLAPGQTFYAAVTSSGDAGLQSDFSDEVSFVVPGQFALPPTLTFVTNGSGAILGPPDVQQFVAGSTYTFTAVPAKGWYFDGWSGSTNWAGTNLTFLFNFDLMYTANFSRTVPLPGGVVAGAFHGLFADTNGTKTGSAGSIDLVVTTRGTYSGTLNFGQKRLSYHGRFDGNGLGTNQIPRGSMGPLALELQFGDATQPGWVFGHVTDGNWVADLQAERALISSSTSAFAGTYTLVISSRADSALPLGDGYGAIRVSKRGVGTFAGVLADGTSIGFSAPVSATGDWAFYSPLYRGNGLIMNTLNFSGPEVSPAGELNWIKPSDAKSRYYPGGFSGLCNALGSVYSPPVSARPVLGVSNAQLIFLGGEVPEGETNLVTLAGSGRVLTANPRGLRLSFSLGTGLFKGNRLNPSSGRAENFGGVVNQNLNAAYGLLLGTNQGALVILAP